MDKRILLQTQKFTALLSALEIERAKFNDMLDKSDSPIYNSHFLKITITNIARSLDIDPRTYHYWLKGQNYPTDFRTLIGTNYCLRGILDDIKKLENTTNIPAFNPEDISIGSSFDTIDFWQAAVKNSYSKMK